ncbi:MAG: bifunctional 3-phenylpropionate/cinnamic acid dioxygenase ferredoxin subunit [Nostocoides sp.]|uniref:bifunctional 3-phenylpropionate/cinnamic acid dioxygenase ferredoxin subunit n=1 Tax=Nostocoides sp. TaxID=1917966 RepID=UPI002C6066C2|nr:bifunctional 3-phenylpropionate/cinnamic acid dioxygenase ferredoxin subunit [Tetrasphaera sp.]
MSASTDLVAVAVCRLDELPEVGPARADIYGQAVAVVHTQDGEVYAIDDTCSHANVSLSEGELEGCQLECWLHGSRFDVRTGEPSGLPATVPVATFPVSIEDGDVFVYVPASLIPESE